MQLDLLQQLNAGIENMVNNQEDPENAVQDDNNDMEH